jgi:hypothetical protein
MLNPCMNMYHLHSYQISDWSDFKYGRQVAILENQQSDITPELMAGSSPKSTLNNTRVSDLTTFSRSQMSKFQMTPLVGKFRYYMT